MTGPFKKTQTMKPATDGEYISGLIMSTRSWALQYGVKVISYELSEGFRAF
jgi:hypothetical protein